MLGEITRSVLCKLKLFPYYNHLLFFQYDLCVVFVNSIIISYKNTARQLLHNNISSCLSPLYARNYRLTLYSRFAFPNCLRATSAIIYVKRNACWLFLLYRPQPNYNVGNPAHVIFYQYIFYHKYKVFQLSSVIIL